PTIYRALVVGDRGIDSKVHLVPFTAAVPRCREGSSDGGPAALPVFPWALDCLKDRDSPVFYPRMLGRRGTRTRRCIDQRRALHGQAQMRNNPPYHRQRARMIDVECASTLCRAPPLVLLCVLVP